MKVAERPPDGWVIASVKANQLHRGWITPVTDGWGKIEAVVVGGASKRKAHKSCIRLWIHTPSGLQHQAVTATQLIQIAAPSDELEPEQIA